jgi:hypothetical protein
MDFNRFHDVIDDLDFLGPCRDIDQGNCDFDFLINGNGLENGLI